MRFLNCEIQATKTTRPDKTERDKWGAQCRGGFTRVLSGSPVVLTVEGKHSTQNKNNEDYKRLLEPSNTFYQIQNILI